MREIKQDSDIRYMPRGERHWRRLPDEFDRAYTSNGNTQERVSNSEVSQGEVKNVEKRYRVSRGALLLVLVTIVSLISALIFGLAWSSDQGYKAQEAQVRSVSSGFLLSLTNFDPKTIDADFSRIQSYATGSFAAQSKQYFNSPIRQELIAAIASSRGQIRHLFIESLKHNSAQTYGVIDQTYVNSKVKVPQTDTLRILLGLTHTSFGWRISTVTVLR